MAFVPAFKRVVDECAVPGNFKAWMVANSILDADRFLLACPHGVDRDLIETCSINLSISDKIAIRYAFRCCRIAAEDAERARIAAAASPGTADIPTETLKDVFERRHAYMLLTKRLLNGSLVKELYHGWHKHPKQLKFYLPRQLLITNTAEPVGTGFSVIGNQMIASSILPTDDPFDNIQLFKVIRAYLNSLSFVTITDPAWFPLHVGEELADQLLDWMNTKYDGRRLPLQYFIQAYTTMFDHFIEMIKTHDTSLAELVSEVEFYRPLWTNMSAGVNNNGNNGGRGGGGGVSSPHPDTSSAVTGQIKKLQEQNQRAKEEMDRMRSEYTRLLRTHPSSYPGATYPGATSNGNGNGNHGGGNGNGNGNYGGGGGKGGDNGGGQRSGGGGGGQRSGGGGGNNNGNDKVPLKRKKPNNDRFTPKR